MPRRLRSQEEKRPLDRGEVWREARAIIWERRGRLAIGFVVLIIGRLAGLVLPASSKWIIDEVIGRQRFELLYPIAIAAGVATIIQALSGFGLSQILGVTAQHSITEMRKAVQRHVIRLPTATFDSTKSGVLISRIMSDAEGLRNLVGTGLVQLFGGSLTAAIAIGVLFWLNARITLVMIVTMGAFAVLMAFVFRSVRPIFRERGAINADVTGRLAETLGGIRVVKSYVAEPREDEIFSRGVDNLFDNVKKSITAISATNAATTILFGIAGIIMMVMGSRAILAGEMTLGDLTMFIIFTGMAAGPIIQMASIGTQITEAFAGLDRIREIRREPIERDAEDTVTVDTIRGDIEFRNVWFEYEPDKPVLRDVSFVAPAGTTTALVGPSGSGKSTLIGLVMTFNQPKEGTILVDGIDLSTLSLSRYRSRLGIVLQENFLFDGSVLDNIRYGRPDASVEEVKRVARIAHVDEFVEPLEEGYDSIVGERGIKLSGGQRQRIAIARAILADPTILILDEATSSLDSESEAKIQDGLRSLRRGRTTFVIAHRLSTIRSADQILVLEEGRVVERGTHAELMALDGRYRTLHDTQYSLETDRFVNPGEELGEHEPETEPIPSKLVGERDL
ncbi:MAG: ABC transporter ATP-binding protein/permease [Acidobacteria bacterium]|nr:ABC transporter ATP-binding protein/permease [Acidobacteriota bacterium]